MVVLTNKPQAKIITVTHGKIFFFSFDLRKSSKTFGKYFGLIISSKSDYSLYIPAGFAHGFLCLSKECMVNYKSSQYRDGASEKTLSWNDKDVNVLWPMNKPILSNKDMNLGSNLNEFLNL